MVETLLVDLYDQQLQAVRKSLEGWEHLPAEQGDDKAFGQLVLLAVELADAVFRLHRIVWEKIMSGWTAQSDLANFGQGLGTLFTRLESLLEVVRRLAAARPNSPTEHLDRLENARDCLRMAQHDHATGWPRFEPVDLQELRASVARGESLDLEDSFAEITGMTREGWLQFVDEYKAKFPHRFLRETGS